MSSITLKRLLGTENVGGSRSVLNSNFEITENSINLLKDYIDTDIAGGKLTMGNIEIPIGANAVTDTLFSLAASGTIAGNLIIDGNLDVTSETVWTGSSLFKNALVVDGAGASALFTLGGNGDVDFEQIEGLMVETQFSTTTPVLAYAVTTAGSIFEPSILTRVLYLDYTGYVLGDGTNGAFKLELPAGSKVGERMFIRPTFIHADMVGVATDKGVVVTNTNIHADWANFANGATAAFHMQGATAVEVQRQWLALVWTSAGWNVENAHPTVLGF